jgi:hypothetical protein
MGNKRTLHAVAFQDLVARVIRGVTLTRGPPFGAAIDSIHHASVTAGSNSFVHGRQCHHHSISPKVRPRYE